MSKIERERKLLADIELWASLAQKNPLKAQLQVSRMLAVILELHHGRHMNTTHREALVESLKASTIGDTGTIELDGNRLFINEEFDCRELAKRMVW